MIAPTEQTADVFAHHQTWEEQAARSFIAALRPPEEMLPSEFAARYRILREGTTERPGPWSNDIFPYLVGIMDAAVEAIRTGRYLVLMKSGQGGGSEAIINVIAWLLVHYPGPMLYLISKEALAREFAYERFGPMIDSCAPLAAKNITGKGTGASIQIKRFVDGKLSILSGKSTLNLQTLAFRIVAIDEYDSLLDEIEGAGDPLALVQVRLDSYSGPTLVIAFAHPSTRDRGAGKLYYEQSDQRRGFVACPHCGGSFWLQWEHVKVTPKDGQTADRAARDPSCYAYFAPCCGAQITDAQRWTMAKNTRQVSTLPAEEAAGKRWIGVHFNQLYMSNKTLEFLAREWIAGLDDESVRRVFINKRMGDVFDSVVKETSADTWRRLIVIPKGDRDPEAYVMGQVPPGVQWLTAGQDSRETELHWSVWGWGWLMNAAAQREFCGWLIDAGVVLRQKSEILEPRDLACFDQLLYSRSFPSTDGKLVYWVVLGLHDSGWQPVGAYEYCRQRNARTGTMVSLPSKGAAETEGSNAPPLRWSAVPTYELQGQKVTDPAGKLALMNTYQLKTQFSGIADRRVDLPGGAGFHARITLPGDTPSAVIAQLASERIVAQKKEKVWKRRGPNHWWDCAIMAYAAALDVKVFSPELTAEEQTARAASDAARAARRVSDAPGSASDRPIRSKY
jgi:phage terminase large subunit GpA-like protein